MSPGMTYARPSASAIARAERLVHARRPRPTSAHVFRTSGDRMTQRIRYQLPDRNLGLDVMRVTEAAAMAAGRWAGRGDKEAGDQAAVDQMRLLMNTVPMRGVGVIGEGEKDQAPMLYNGEHVGRGEGPEYDVAVDPVDG